MAGTRRIQFNRAPTRKLRNELLLVPSFGNVQEAVVLRVGMQPNASYSKVAKRRF